jgi:hypothetical protein
MDQDLTTQQLLTLRRVTRAVADHLRAQLEQYLATLLPLVRPRSILGNYVRGGETKENPKSVEKAFVDVRALYESIAGAKPFNVTKDLKTPISVGSSTFELNNMTYPHQVTVEDRQKTVIITMPLKWSLTYAGFSLARLNELVAQRSQTTGRRDLADTAGDELEAFLAHYLMLHVAFANQPGIGQMLDALHFGLSTEKVTGLGELPVMTVASAISTFRPPDSIIVESTELAGRDVFDEAIDLDSIRNLQDDFKLRLIEMVRSKSPELMPE